MYLRFETWQEVNSVEEVEQGSWYNVFQVPFPCADIRLRLKGYGWKPNTTDENIPVLYEGVYKCYYRKHGGSDWVLFATAVVERAATEDAFVYKDIIVDTGYLEKDKYEVKVIASYGDRFDAWGGAIEGISRLGQYWYGLEMLADRPLAINVADSVGLEEYCYGGKEIIELNLVEVIPTVDYFDRIVHGYLIWANEDTITHTEFVDIFWDNYKLFIQVINVTEYVAFWSDQIQLWSPQEDVNIVEDWYGYIFPFYFYYYESINVVENVVIDKWDIFRDIDVVENINCNDVLYSIFPVPPWRPNVIEETLVDEYVKGERFVYWLEDYCLGTWANWTTYIFGTSAIAEDLGGEFHVGMGASSDAWRIDLYRSKSSPTYRDWEVEAYFKFDDAYTGDAWGKVSVVVGGTLLCYFYKPNNQSPLDNWQLYDQNGVIVSGKTYPPATYLRVRVRGQYGGVYSIGSLYINEELIKNNEFTGFPSYNIISFQVERSGSAMPQVWLDKAFCRNFDDSAIKNIVVAQSVSKTEVFVGRKDLGINPIQNISVVEYKAFTWDSWTFNLFEYVNLFEFIDITEFPIDVFEVLPVNEYRFIEQIRTILYSDCSSLSGWTTGGSGTNVREVVGGKIHLSATSTPAYNSPTAWIRRSITPSAHFICEMKVKIDTNHPPINSFYGYALDLMYISIGGSVAIDFDATVYFMTNKIIQSSEQIGLMPITWNTEFNLKLEIIGGSKHSSIQVWMDNVLVGAGVYTYGGTSGQIIIYCKGYYDYEGYYWTDITLDEIFIYTVDGDPLTSITKFMLSFEGVTNVIEYASMSLDNLVPSCFDEASIVEEFVMLGEGLIGIFPDEFINCIEWGQVFRDRIIVEDYFSNLSFWTVSGKVSVSGGECVFDTYGTNNEGYLQKFNATSPSWYLAPHMDITFRLKYNINALDNSGYFAMVLVGGKDRTQGGVGIDAVIKWDRSGGATRVSISGAGGSASSASNSWTSNTYHDWHIVMIAGSFNTYARIYRDNVLVLEAFLGGSGATYYNKDELWFVLANSSYMNLAYLSNLVIRSKELDPTRVSPYFTWPMLRSDVVSVVENVTMVRV